MPDVSRIKNPRNAAERRRWTDGRELAIQQDVGATMDAVTLPVRWNWQIDADSSLSLRLAASDLRIDNDALRHEDGSGDAPHRRRNRLRQHGRNHFLDLDYHTVLAAGHEITAGGKLVRGQPDLSLQVLGRDSTTRMDSSRLFLQDEWRIDRTLALNAGLSVERRVYTFDEGVEHNRADFNMWSPSMHLSKKIGGDRKRQLRLSLARSFQPPESDQMLLHPTIDRFAPCRPGRLCGANDIETADRSGNPDLQPERALGLNLSYTHGIGSSSEVLVEGYARDIQDKTGYEFALANVPWASVPRWVVRPVNLGQARVRGVNFEGRVAGKDLSKDLSTLEVHGSLGFARSELSDVPGPDNRIDGQLPWRLKLGGSYTLKAAPLKLGIEASVLPADWVRDSVNQRVYQSGRNTLGVNGSWKIDAKSRVTLNLDNLLHRTATRIEEYQSGPELLRLTSGNADYARISVKFDTSL
jgi:outer membrane receptor for ferrienterochelin and colicins